MSCTSVDITSINVQRTSMIHPFTAPTKLRSFLLTAAPNHVSWASSTQPVTQLNENDVCLSSRTPADNGVGNSFLNSLLNLHAKHYNSTTKRLEKRRICDEIIQTVHQSSPPGRFLKTDSVSLGSLVVADEEFVRRKVANLLRRKRPLRLLDNVMEVGTVADGMDGAQGKNSPHCRSPATGFALEQKKSFAALLVLQQNILAHMLRDVWDEDK